MALEWLRPVSQETMLQEQYSQASWVSHVTQGLWLGWDRRINNRVNQGNTWAGTCYITPLIGAILADAYWGRYWTIAVFSTIYFVERRLIQEIDNMEKDTGYKLRILAQNYPDTPGNDNEKKVKQGRKFSGILDNRKIVDGDLQCFDLDAIISMTDNFADENKIGKGGFGSVYKGRDVEGRDVAVKRLAVLSGQGLEEYTNEVLLIGKLQHRNLVRLFGFCITEEEKILVYEYMKNKSLDTFLFGEETNRAILDWRKRVDIIIGIARGILYLHHDSRLRIIHRDLKAGNILLDEEMNPRISDFGTARLFSGDQLNGSTRRVIGTYGYMSPEYAMDGIYSVKSDVFSFGVLMLEIISGLKNKQLYETNRDINLLALAWRLWNEERVLELLDDTVTSTHSASQVRRHIQIALLCIQEIADDRPTMSTVVSMLSNESSPLPQPKRPGFCKARSTARKDVQSSESQSSSTVNEITLTMIAGR